MTKEIEISKSELSITKGGLMKLIISSLLLTLSFTTFGASATTQLDDLIRGEMAAVESYNQAIKDISDVNEKTKLVKIKNDHEVAFSKLETFASKEVKKDTKTSGAWGEFTKVWTGGATLVGNETALKALTQGEKHGINEYNEALEDKTIKPELKKMIRTQFIPKQEEHLKTIKSLM